MSTFLNMQIIALAIKKNRELCGMTQADLATASGVSRATIIGIEKGTIKEIGFFRLSKIAEIGEKCAKAATIADVARQPVQHSFSNKKSSNIGLSIPYDWSNPNISDDALILNVLQRGFFKDICKVVLHYGFSSVSEIAGNLPEDDICTESVARMMSNIKWVIENAN